MPDIFGWETAEDYLREGNGPPYVQGPPVEGCPDPACANHGQAGSLRTFVIV